MYSHPIEFLLASTSNVAAFSILKSHVMTCLLWMTITVLTGIVDHSGLDLPLLSDSTWHDYHHETLVFSIKLINNTQYNSNFIYRNTVHFSSYKIMDVIMNTDRKFNEEAKIEQKQKIQEKTIKNVKNHHITDLLRTRTSRMR